MGCVRQVMALIDVTTHCLLGAGEDEVRKHPVMCHSFVISVLGIVEIKSHTEILLEDLCSPLLVMTMTKDLVSGLHCLTNLVVSFEFA